ncbi:MULTISPECIES: hypothetical protein [unclassified Schaalia]|uniref:hypothetical protein n=1 Tax=unclassified Schaalia TaxID=2691889 RepID=UPI001E56B86B|nr:MULTISPECIES: hypothetical protein [unclassified Schaalia]MCD4550204.1 hypothetical protein [Schaalia sp. lx-260]MCD4557376.1 hypothetical protein [Schaalia sp. lx-100]
MLSRGPQDHVCTARHCEKHALWRLTWTNPAVRTGRKKIWLSCEQHRHELEQYLAYRRFPVEVEEYTEPTHSDEQ